MVLVLDELGNHSESKIKLGQPSVLLGKLCLSVLGFPKALVVRFKLRRCDLDTVRAAAVKQLPVKTCFD